MRSLIPELLSAELSPIGLPAAAARTGGAERRRLLSLRSGRIGLAFVGLTVGIGVIGPLLSTTDPFALSGPALAAPSLAHPMGTDALGRDLFSGVVAGARTSLLVALMVGALAFAIGVSVGLLGGFRGGVIDNVLTRITEMFQVLPRFFLVVIAVALLGPGLDRMIVTLAITSWPMLARVVRSDVMALRDIDFVVAAEAAGASPARIVWRELLPNVLPSAVVMLGLLIGQVLLIEASLGFLGLGDPNAMSWGMLAGQAQGFVRVAWWLPLFPGLAIMVAVLGFNLLADALMAVLNGAHPSNVSPVV